MRLDTTALRHPPVSCGLCLLPPLASHIADRPTSLPILAHHSLLCLELFPSDLRTPAIFALIISRCAFSLVFLSVYTELSEKSKLSELANDELYKSFCISIHFQLQPSGALESYEYDCACGDPPYGSRGQCLLAASWQPSSQNRIQFKISGRFCVEHLRHRPTN